MKVNLKRIIEITAAMLSLTLMGCLNEDICG